jgi:hypothetical protein
MKGELKRRRKMKNLQVIQIDNIFFLELPDDTNNNITQEVNNTTHM